jgi:DNA modification methylase
VPTPLGGKDWRIIHGDCRQVLPTLPAASFDVIFTDPPYPCIKRPYGTWTEAEWFGLMRTVVPEVRRVLKPTGSAVFVLQPNSRKVGSMRSWLWEFMAWVHREWNVVQDAWWWNPCILPQGGATIAGLMRASVKAIIWCGPPDCHRDQAAALWEPNWSRIAHHAERRAIRRTPSGYGVNEGRVADTVIRRGGATPFNLLPINNANSRTSAGANGHGAGTPLALCSWWIRYLCPPGGAVLDPFCGTATAGAAALRHGVSFTGIECVSEYISIARRRLSECEPVTGGCA